MTSSRFQRPRSYALRWLHSYNWRNQGVAQNPVSFSNFVHDIQQLRRSIQDLHREVVHTVAAREIRIGNLFGLVGLPDWESSTLERWRPGIRSIESLPAMAKGAPNPVTRRVLESVLGSAAGSCGSLTHESPISPEEVLGQGVEGDVGARALGVVVGAAELGASGGEATTGSDGGQSGTDSGGGVHLRSQCELAVIASDPIALRSTYLEVQRGESGRSGMDGRNQNEHRKVRNGSIAGHGIPNPVT